MSKQDAQEVTEDALSAAEAKALDLPSNLVKPIDAYLEYLKFERQLSKHTVSNYQRDILSLAEYCVQQMIPDWNTVTPSQMRYFAAIAYRDGLGAKSIQRRLSACRNFFAYLLREHQVKNNPVNDIRAPKAPKKLPKTLDVDAMMKLLDMQGEGPQFLRDKAMLEMLYSSGLRLSELVSLDLDSIDFGEQLVRVTGKGNKTRIVPVGKQAMSAMREWLAVRKDWLKADLPEHHQAVFLSNRGKRISPRSVQERVKYWARKQGLDGTLHPHQFRHSFASHVLQSSGDLRAVQELLGHADISTTQIYTHLDFQHLASVYDKAHPRAKK